MTVATEPSPQAVVAPPEPVLEISNLHLSFPGTPPVPALRGVSLSIGPGEVVGLVGESGSGKTVLGLAALGLLPPLKGLHIEGQVRLGGLDMATAPEAQRRARRGVYVGAVFQDPMAALNPAMRVGRQVAEAAGGADRRAVAALLADAGVPHPEERARQYPHELSGGLRQRVTIAMAVARAPRLVVADEPTTALDVTVQAHVLALLGRLRERGTSVLLVTHDLAVAASICDRIAVAYAGRIVEHGPTSALLAARRRVGAPVDRSERGRGRFPPTPTRWACWPAARASTGRPGRLPRWRGACPTRATCPVGVPSYRAARSPRRAVPSSPHRQRSGRSTPWSATARASCSPGRRRPSTISSRWLAWTRHPSPFRPRAPRVAPTRPCVLHQIVKEFGGSTGRLRLGATRPPFRAVDEVSVDLRRGGALAIVGESGCGKTTLLRMVVGLLTPTSGTIHHGPGAPPQLIFQDAGASLTPWLTVGQMLGERLTRSGVAHSEREQRIREALEAVGLAVEVAALRPRQLSGGQRQRAAIARAVIVPPALLACDEPVSALDVSLAAQVLNLLGELRRRLHLTLLFVTHDLAVARAVADEILVMHDGRVVERGEVEQVLRAPREAYTRALLDAVPKMRPLLAREASA